MDPHPHPDPQSWVFGANDPALGLGLTHLPYTAHLDPDSNTPHLAVAIGACLLDLHILAPTLPPSLSEALRSPTLNPFMSLGPAAWATLRAELQARLSLASSPTSREHRKATEQALIPTRTAALTLPIQTPNYTDFYASIHHATRVGRLFRPDTPLLPNYKHLPIGYHGRASSLIPSGNPVRRPWGQIHTHTRPAHTRPDPTFAPTQSLDYELELAFYIGTPNPLGHPIPIAQAEDHIFGISLLNDWSARDLQSWESQPLGPFLAKSFATTVSPFITPIAALAPFRTNPAPRDLDDPHPLPYLQQTPPTTYDVQLNVSLLSGDMRRQSLPATRLSASNLKDLYWTPAQLVAHHTSNGCNLQIGDILATGTISGPQETEAGCLLELTRNGAHPLTLPTGEMRAFLHDGDEIILTATCARPGYPSITLGECRSRILPAAPGNF